MNWGEWGVGAEERHVRQGVHSADANVRRLAEIMQPSLFTGYYPAGTCGNGVVGELGWKGGDE